MNVCRKLIHSCDENFRVTTNIEPARNAPTRRFLCAHVGAAAEVLDAAIQLMAKI